MLRSRIEISMRERKSHSLPGTGYYGRATGLDRVSCHKIGSAGVLCATDWNWVRSTRWWSW